MKRTLCRVVPLSIAAGIVMVSGTGPLAAQQTPVVDSAAHASAATLSRLAEFTARRKGGAGRFVTDSVLRAHETEPLVSVLRAYVPGFARAMDAQYLTSATIAPTCLVDVYVDGMHSSAPIDDIRTDRVAAAEFYDRTMVPPQYRRVRSPCDVLLLWTK